MGARLGEHEGRGLSRPSCFYGSVYGGSLPFNWVNVKDNATYNVRFKGELKARHTVMDFWNVSLTLEQV